jgi:glycosyltransferase involved in cell wall biosynthesis
MNGSVQTPVSVVLPAYNEENAIGAQIEAIRSVLTSHEILHEVVVVDDGSHDRTTARAVQAGARVLRHPRNRGYGASLKTGILAATYETILIIDADQTYPVDEMPNLLAKLENADMVVGARIGKNVHIPLLRRVPKLLLTALAARIAGEPIPDLNSGMRVFRRDCVKQYFAILPKRFSFTTTITLALLGDDYRVLYHPIDYFRRVGRSKITPRNFMDFVVLVLRMAMLFQPLRIFVPLAFACVGLGILKTVFDVLAVFQRASGVGWHLLYQPAISTSAVLLLLAGLQLLMIGMMADGLIRRIARNNNGPLLPSHAIATFESVTAPFGSVTEPAPPTRVLVGAARER